MPKITITYTHTHIYTHKLKFKLQRKAVLQRGSQGELCDKCQDQNDQQGTNWI